MWGRHHAVRQGATGVGRGSVCSFRVILSLRDENHISEFMGSMVEGSGLNETSTSGAITPEAQKSLKKRRWKDCRSRSWWRTAEKQ